LEPRPRPATIRAKEHRDGPGRRRTIHVNTAAGPFDYGLIEPGYYDDVHRRARGVQSKWHHLKFEAVRAAVGDAEPLLDVGCGPGTFLGTIAGGRRCVGLDVAPAQIEFARRTYATAAKSFELMAGGRLPVGDAEFGVVTMIEVVEHLTEPVEALREAVRALRPGGRLVVTTPTTAATGRCSSGWWDGSRRWTTRTSTSTHFRAATLRRALEDAGLASVA